MASTGLGIALSYPKLFTFVAALVIGRIETMLIDYFMWKAFKFDPMNGMDEMFVVHKPGSAPNVSIMIASEKFEYGKMRDFLKNANKKVPRLAHKV